MVEKRDTLKKPNKENEIKNSNTQRYLEEPVLNIPLPSKVSSSIKAHSTQKQTVTKMNTTSHYVLNKHALVVKEKKLVVICTRQYSTNCLT